MISISPARFAVSSPSRLSGGKRPRFSGDNRLTVDVNITDPSSPYFSLLRRLASPNLAYDSDMLIRAMISGYIAPKKGVIALTEIGKQVNDLLGIREFRGAMSELDLKQLLCLFEYNSYYGKIYKTSLIKNALKPQPNKDETAGKYDLENLSRQVLQITKQMNYTLFALRIAKLWENEIKNDPTYRALSNAQQRDPSRNLIRERLDFLHSEEGIRQIEGLKLLLTTEIKDWPKLFANPEFAFNPTRLSEILKP